MHRGHDHGRHRRHDHGPCRLSVGWGDFYLWNLAWQWIDVSGLPAGDYVVRARADPQAMFSEANTTDNMTWTKIRITTTNAVTVLEQGPSA